MSTIERRYTFKPEAASSHSIILGWLEGGRGRQLLDVGAADGLLSRYLTARGWRVTAIEVDRRMAAAGATHCERMVVADLARMIPEFDAPFDAIVYADVLEHLPDPLGVLVALNHSLAPGGRVIVSVPNVAHLWIRLSLAMGRFDYADLGILDRTHLRFFTHRSLHALMAEAGLHVIRQTATPVPLYKVVPAGWQGPWLPPLHAAGAAAARRFRRLLGYQFIVLAAREPAGRTRRD